MTRFILLLLILLPAIGFSQRKVEAEKIHATETFSIRKGINRHDFTGATDTIDSGSTHAQIPTAKSVWDLLSGLGGGGSGSGHVILEGNTPRAQKDSLEFQSNSSVALAATNTSTRTVVEATIQSNAINSAEIAADAVGNSELAANAVDSSNIVNGGISVLDLGQHGASSGQVLKWNGTQWAPAADNNSGGTLTGSGTANQLTYFSGASAVTSSYKARLYPSGGPYDGEILSISAGNVSGAIGILLDSIPANDAALYALNVSSATTSWTALKAETYGGNVTDVVIQALSNNSNASSDAAFLVQTASTGGDPHMRFSTGGSNRWAVGVDNSDSDNFKFTYGNGANPGSTTTAVDINTSGNVGIGGAPVAAKALTVTGVQRLTAGTGTPDNILGRDASGDINNVTIGTGLSLSAGTLSATASGADDWGTQVVETTARLTGDGTLGTPLDIAQQGATSGQALKWSGTAWAPADDAGVTGSGTNPAFPYWTSTTALGSSGMYWDAGNSRVGINYSSPGAPLQIGSSAAGNDYIQLNNSSSGNPLLRMFNSGIQDAQMTSKTFTLDAAYGGFSLNTNLEVNGRIATSAEFSSIGLNSIGSGVSSGIAQGTPGGAIRLRAGSGAAQYLNFIENGVAFRGSLGFANGVADMTIRMGAQNFSDGTERFRFTNGGHLLVNTTSDAATIHAKGSGATSATYGLIVTGSGGATATASLAVRDDNRVGINTNAPLAPLNVVGTGTTSSSNSFLVESSSGTDNLTIRDDGVAIAQGLAMVSSAPSIAFGTGAGTSPVNDLCLGGANGFSLFFTTGTSPTAGAAIFTATLPKSYQNGVVCTITCGTDTCLDKDSEIRISGTSNNSVTLTMKSGSSLVASTAYTIHTTCIGY